MAKKHFQCPKCQKYEARRTKYVYNPDGSKNTHHPVIYYGLFLLLGITVVMRLEESLQLPVAIAFAAVGVAVVVGLTLWRRRLRSGYQYLCWNCEYFWDEIDPPKTPAKKK